MLLHRSSHCMIIAEFPHYITHLPKTSVRARSSILGIQRDSHYNSHALYLNNILFMTLLFHVKNHSCAIVKIFFYQWSPKISNVWYLMSIVSGTKKNYPRDIALMCFSQCVVHYDIQHCKWDNLKLQLSKKRRFFGSGIHFWNPA